MAPRAPATVSLAVLAALALVAPSQGSEAVCREGEAGCHEEEEAALLQASATQAAVVRAHDLSAGNATQTVCPGDIDLTAICKGQGTGHDYAHNGDGCFKWQCCTNGQATDCTPIHVSAGWSKIHPGCCACHDWSGGWGSWALRNGGGATNGGGASRLARKGP